LIGQIHMPHIYLDFNATTPIHPVAGDAMRPLLRDNFGNPSSSHWFGLQARKVVDESRARVAALLKCLPEEIIFTSGGSESDNFAIAGYARKHRACGNHIITSQVEHPAVLEICRVLEAEGFEVTCLPVDETGQVGIDDLKSEMRSSTILISIMQANNEVGTLQPISEIAALAHERNIVVHTDSAQAVGKIPVDVASLGADMITVAGHKFYAPKGIGALYVRRGIELQPLIVGAGQEQGRRAGTENVLGIVGLGAACALVSREMPKRAPEMQRLRDLLEAELLKRLPQIRINGHPTERLPNTLSVSFPGIEANRIVSALGDTVACSPGAACHSGKVSLSHVLEAMKVPLEYAMGAIRFSLGYATTEADIHDAVEAILKAIAAIK
jgi:cysteine desulfurase